MQPAFRQSWSAERMLEMPLPSDTPKEFEMTCEMKEVKSLGVGSDSDFNVSDWLGRFNATPTRGRRLFSLCSSGRLRFDLFAPPLIWRLPAPWFQLACKRHLFHAIHAAAFRSLIAVRGSMDDCKVLWFRSSPRRKLISPPSRMAKPER
jgi:hypothetical protein